MTVLSFIRSLQALAQQSLIQYTHAVPKKQEDGSNDLTQAAGQNRERYGTDGTDQGVGWATVIGLESELRVLCEGAY
ncbi:MAG TPA: hypothetical protein VN345_02440, partial [Blastocatellia bacterium]|nr:hypothetical protein [Blastocatellia bacterium]